MPSSSCSVSSSSSSPSASLSDGLPNESFPHVQTKKRTSSTNKKRASTIKWTDSDDDGSTAASVLLDQEQQPQQQQPAPAVLRPSSHSSRETVLCDNPPPPPHRQNPRLAVVRRPRPLPAMHVLAAAAAAAFTTSTTTTATTNVPRILRNFFRELGKDPAAAIVVLLASKNIRSDDDDDDNMKDGQQQSYTVEQSAKKARVEIDGVVAGDDGTTAIATSTDDDNPTAMTVSSLWDTKHSSMTTKQHQRFLQLAVQFDDRNNNHKHHTIIITKKGPTRKEYQKLVRLVSHEQDLYQQTLQKFWKSNPYQRLSLGFTATAEGAHEGAPPPSLMHALANIALFPECIQSSWKSILMEQQRFPQRYGAHKQVISLYNNLVSEQFASLTLDDIKSCVLVHPTPLDSNKSVVDLPSVTDQWFNQPNTCTIPPPKEELMLPVLVLTDQDIEVANQHKADVITTEETLLALLKSIASSDHNDSPGAGPKHNTNVVSATTTTPPSILIPVARQTSDSLVALNVPIPQPYASPREALEYGADEALYQFLQSSHGSVDANDEDSSSLAACPPAFQIRYTLLQIPTKSRLPLRVLVRSRIRILSNDVPTTILKLHARLEYFPEHGNEQPTSLDQAIWVLDHLLGDDITTSKLSSTPMGRSGTTRARVVVCRVNPSNAQCLGWEDASWANTTTSESGRWYERPTFESSSTSTTELWRRLATLLCATRTIGMGRHVLCAPRRGDVTSSQSFATIHPEDTTDDASIIDVLQEVQAAREVKLDPDAYARCLRHWQWDIPIRVPYTFPTDPSTT